MSIVTKIGDKGRTNLFRGKKVDKDHIRIEVCGTLDELGACLGLAKTQIRNKKEKAVIKSIQSNLLIIATEIATEYRFLGKLKIRINDKCIKQLEDNIKKIEKENKPNKRFVLSGKNILSSYLDLSRTTARRAERRVVTLKKNKILKNKQILIYLNRLSDFLYLLARSYEK